MLLFQFSGHIIPSDSKIFGTYIVYQVEGDDTAPLVVKTPWPQEYEILVSTRGILKCIRKREVDRISYVSSRW